MSTPDQLANSEAVETIDCTPNWEGMRRWVLHVFRTDPAQARKIAAAMGCEAPNLPEEIS